MVLYKPEKSFWEKNRKKEEETGESTELIADKSSKQKQPKGIQWTWTHVREQ